MVIGMMKLRTYTELSQLETFLDRYNYLKLGGKVGEETFGFERLFNQEFYRSKVWRKIRRDVIVRDMGCDLGMPDRELQGNVRIYVHHMNPITLEDIENRNPILLCPEYLISCSFETHNAIHYGDSSLLILDEVERKPNDTVPWR